MKIYTKTGDSGISSLYNGSRKGKNNIIFTLLGDLDELNCNLGMIKALYNEEMEKQEIKVYSAPGAGAIFYKHNPGIDSGKYYEWFAFNEYIRTIQNNIMNISTLIATPPYDSQTKISDMEYHLENWCNKFGFIYDNVMSLEEQIDRFESILPKLKNFVIPSGNKLIAQIHIARAITRRCERVFTDLYSKEGEYYYYLNTFNVIDINVENVRIYINRLSDYFFMLSRFVGMTLNIEEDIYKPI